MFGFHRYIGLGQNGRFYRPQQVLTKRCYNSLTSRQLALESTTNLVKAVILQQRYQVRFHKQADKTNHEACIGRRSRDNSIIINQIN